MPGVVRMQALDPGARAADPAARCRAGRVGRYRGVALTAIALVRGRELIGRDRRLSPFPPPARLEPIDGEAFAVADEPVPGRHRRPVVEYRRVPDHHGAAV